jgi:hypothetical protein
MSPDKIKGNRPSHEPEIDQEPHDSQPVESDVQKLRQVCEVVRETGRAWNGDMLWRRNCGRTSTAIRGLQSFVDGVFAILHWSNSGQDVSRQRASLGVATSNVKNSKLGLDCENLSPS